MEREQRADVRWIGWRFGVNGGLDEEMVALWSEHGVYLSMGAHIPFVSHVRCGFVLVGIVLNTICERSCDM